MKASGGKSLAGTTQGQVNAHVPQRTIQGYGERNPRDTEEKLVGKCAEDTPRMWWKFPEGGSF